MADTVNNSPTNHVDFDWADQQNFPSVAKAFWKKLQSLFDKAGVQGQFFLFHKITQTHIHPCQATKEISSIIQLFNQLTHSGLNLPNFFYCWYFKEFEWWCASVTRQSLTFPPIPILTMSWW